MYEKCSVGYTCNLVINIVPADGLAPLGAKPSAGTVMTAFAPCLRNALVIQG